MLQVNEWALFPSLIQVLADHDASLSEIHYHSIQFSRDDEMRKPLWIPSGERRRKANVTRFIDFVNEGFGRQISSYNQLHSWSVDNVPEFWTAMWEFGDIQASRKYDRIVDNFKAFPGARWFPGAKLNFAENLLKYRDGHLAFIFRREDGESEEITYAEAYDRVTGMAASLREARVVPGDRVAAYMPNIPETALAMLAATAVGAAWASCGSELGPRAVVDRLVQIEPKILFTVAGYPYKGKIFDMVPRIREVAGGLPSLEKIIIVPYSIEKPDIAGLSSSELLEDFADQRCPTFHFEHLSSDHPLYIMFSSGTTGKPKCMVQGSGGILINHLKELVLHTDLGRSDRIFYISTPSWMMWNWLLSSLAVGATVVLYDGNPLYPDWRTLWEFAEDKRITIFGCSASYINYLKNQGAAPSETYDLKCLREISQTGSPLSAEGFVYVYQKIKSDFHFNSISGGTDINGCFAAGTPIQPVYAGELQGPALGMKVKAYDSKGNSVVDQEGELVCEAPAPSMPIYFWNDPDGERYRQAYFKVYPGVWRHGDWVLIHRDTGGITFLGRSDFTLKPSGVRIGPAEIYNIVESFREVADSLAAGQEWEGDQRVILFIKLSQGFQFTENLKARIQKALRQQASPRHVPALILEAPDMPYTFNMKKVESAVSNILNGRQVTNREALINPESLAFFEAFTSQLSKDKR